MTITEQAVRTPEPNDTTTRPRTRHHLETVPTEHLEAEVTALAERMHFGTYELLVLVGELDARGAWALWGALSCAAWLAVLCDIEVGTARTQVRIANALRRWPQLDEAMATGEISYAKARTLAAHCTDENIEPLIDIARTTPAGRLGAAIAAWSLRNEDQDVIDDRQHEARSMSWRTEPDGMVSFTIKVPPVAAGKIQAIVDAEMLHHKPDASADAYPSLAQQRADALLRIVDSKTDSAATHGTTDQATEGTSRTTTEVVVHVRPEGNALADGTPLSDNAVGKLLPNAFVSLLIEDNHRRPIDASPRRRFPTRGQRRVIDERDPECAEDGCHARTRLQYDHVVPYPNGGPTTLGNLQRLCGPHNRAKDPR
jgi:hypothetical protein